VTPPACEHPVSPRIRASLTAQHLSSRRCSLAWVRHIAYEALSETERGNRQPHARSLRARGLLARTMEIPYPVKRSSSSAVTCRRPPLNDAFDLSPALWQHRHGKRIARDHLMRWSELPPNEGRD